MIFLKVDANSIVGGGHLHRCISIAEECKNHEIKAAFIFTDTPRELQIKVIKKGFDSFSIPKSEELKPNTYLKILPKGALIIFDTDNYEFYSGELIDALKTNGIKTGCFTISDQHKITTDILINTNIISKTHSYNTPSSTIKLLGPQYLIFGTSFRDTDVLPKTNSHKQNLLLFFGNADAQNLTTLFLSVLDKIKFKFNRINIIVGPLNPEADTIKQVISKLNQKNINYHYNIQNITDLYEETTVAITAAGMTMWEMSQYQIPQMVVASSNREIVYSEYLSQLNYIEFLGTYAQLKSPKIIASTISTILNSGKLRQLKLTDFKKSVNPNGITKMVDTFAAVINKTV